MFQTYFEHYVLNGGWTMLVLIPMSFVTVASIVRGYLSLTNREIVPSSAPHTAAARVAARLDQIWQDHEQLAAADVRAEVGAEALRLFALLQPLSAMFVLAPVTGLAGSISAVMNANLDVARTGGVEMLSAALQQAMVPTLWGLVISALAYAGFAALRARLFYCEKRALLPAAEEHARALLQQPKMRRRAAGPAPSTEPDASRETNP